MPIDRTTTITRVVGLMAQPVDDDLVILNLATNNYIALDAIGRRVWELLATPQRVDDLCMQLNLEFDATSERIAVDVIRFLEELAAEQMLTLL